MKGIPDTPFAKADRYLTTTPQGIHIFYHLSTMQNLVYLALQNSGVKIPSFEEKGISHLMPGELDDVTVVAYSSTFCRHSSTTLISSR